MEIKVTSVIGQTIGHYRILDKLGEGGMGEVFVAEDTRLERRVAVKMLFEHRTDAQNRLRFEREAKAVAALNHPNIVSIHEYGVENDTAYVVTELLEGKTLREILRAGPMMLRQALDCFLEVAKGLAAAHDKGILHRDLKPENLFITRDSRVKILDFGLAKIEENPSGAEMATMTQLTSPGMVLGTSGYMSPEQARGLELDHRSDIFAIGTSLYEALCGHRAFHGPTPTDILSAVISYEPPTEPLSARGVPPPLVRIVYRCLQKRAGDRFQSARDLVFALETVADPAGGHEPPSSASAFAAPLGARASTAVSSVAERSVAVLPFVNLSNDPETEYFSDGMTEEIINALAQLQGLRVAARTSSFAFKGQPEDVTAVGAKLKVNTVVEGSVRRAGDRLRITAQLVNVTDGYQLWSDRYDRLLDDVFAIQDDIATNIAKQLQVTLASAATGPLVRPTTDNLEAYELYLKGRFLVEQRGEGIGQGLELFQRAIQADPDFALAHAGVAEGLCLLAVYGVLPAAEIMPGAQAAARRALELEDDLAEAHNVQALVSVLYEWDWTRAGREFQRAIELNPNLSPPHYWYGLLYLLFVRNRPLEALHEVSRAVELDPLAILPLYAYGLVQVGARRYREATERLTAALEQHPAAFVLHRVLGVSYSGLGQHEEAIAALEKGMALSNRHPWLACELGAIYAAGGRGEEAEKLHQEILARAEHIYVSPITLSVIPLALGRLGEGLDYLDSAYEKREPLLITVRSWPTFDVIRDHPRYHELLGRLELEDRGAL